MDVLRGGMLGRAGLERADNDGSVWRGGGGEPICGRGGGGEPICGSGRRPGNNGAGDLIGAKDGMDSPGSLLSESMFSSEDVYGEPFFGYGLPLKGPFPRSPIPGNRGGASVGLAPVGEMGGASVGLAPVGEMGARAGGSMPPPVGAAVGDEGGLWLMGGRVCGLRAPRSCPPPSVVGSIPIALCAWRCKGPCNGGSPGLAAVCASLAAGIVSLGRP